jgi:hypothetical protein
MTVTCTQHNAHVAHCKPCRLALGEAVYEAWEKTPPTGNSRTVLVKGIGSDRLDTKESLAFLHYLLRGSAPSAPKIYVTPGVMAERLGLDFGTFKRRVAAAFEKGIAHYFLALRSPEKCSASHRMLKRCLNADCAHAQPNKRSIRHPGFLVADGTFGSPEERDRFFLEGDFAACISEAIRLDEHAEQEKAFDRLMEASP